MNFKSNRLPSSLEELKWYWGKCVRGNVNFSRITINEQQIDFTKPVALTEFELNIFGDLNADTQIGVLLSNVNHKRTEASSYGIYATFVYIDKSVYCAFTICLVDKDFGMEMETAVVEIGQDEGPYIQPIFISEEALDYFSYDDIAKLSYWLGNFWVGIQYEMNNRPEEIKIIEQRGSITGNNEEYKKADHIVLVRRIIPIDEDGNIIRYDAIDSERQYSAAAWGVRGHYRTLQNGRVTYVSPHRKGKERNKLDTYDEKEYRFIDEKIDSDIE